MMLSIVIPVYNNHDNLLPLYNDMKKEIIDKIDYEYEIVMVDDGSIDNSFEIMKELAEKDSNIKIIRLSRNFGSHSATLCGLTYCKGDCVAIKAADMQEPSDLILNMVKSWKNGNNVVLAVREHREESRFQVFFSNSYYRMVRIVAFKQMPKTGFDVFLIDRKVVDVLLLLDEKNSALTCQLLWSGFKTDLVQYTRKKREIGKSMWTFRKKIKLTLDTLFSFSTLPIKLVSAVGLLSITLSIVWSAIILIGWLNNQINVDGWTSIMILNLLSFGVIMTSIGIIGEYTWRIFDSSRKRPPFIVEETNTDEKRR